MHLQKISIKRRLRRLPLIDSFYFMFFFFFYVNGQLYPMI